VTTEHEFKTTYRGVDVPAWIADANGDHAGYNGDGIHEAFRAGVDAALGATAAEKAPHQATKPALRTWVDRDGDTAFEVEPGFVVYGEGNPRLLTEVAQRHGPLTLLTD
jgi:hypothetical protein